MALIDGTSCEPEDDAGAVAEGSEDGRDVEGLGVLAELVVRIERYHRRVAMTLVVMVVGIAGAVVIAWSRLSLNDVLPAIFGMSVPLGMFADQWRSVVLARGASVDALLRSAEIESMERDQRIVARVAAVVAVVIGLAALVLGNVQAWTGYLQGPMGQVAGVIGYGVVVACVMVVLTPRFASSVMSHELRQSSMFGVRLKGRGVDEVAAARERERYLAALRAWREGEDGAG